MKNQLIPKKLLIFNFGSIGKKHHTLINKNWPEIKLGVLSSRQNNLKSNLKETRIFNEIQEALNWKPDAVIICSPASKHLKQALFFAENKIPILIEKPIGTGEESKNDWAKLLKLSKKTTIKVGYVLRHHPSLLVLKKELLNKECGEIIEVDFYCGSWLPNWRNTIDYKYSVSSIKKLGGGVLLELSHEIDLAYWLLGDLDLKFALLSKKSNLEINVEDSATLVSFNKEKTLVTIRLNFCTKPEKREIVVRGENGQIFCNLLNGKVTKSLNGREIILFDKEINREEIFLTQHKKFFKNIYSEDCSLCSVQEALKILDFINEAKIGFEK